MRIEPSESSWLTKAQGLAPRVLEHFPMTRKTRLKASDRRESGTLFDWDKAIETHPDEDAPDRAEKGHR
jgi:hypothetical protein